jgi:hypothetical protein
MNGTINACIKNAWLCIKSKKLVHKKWKYSENISM